MSNLLVLLVAASLVVLSARADLVKLKSTRQETTQFPQFTEVSCRSLPTLVCNVQPTEGWETAGVVYFNPIWLKRDPESDQFTCYTRITAEISGLFNPLHGFHVHIYGDLSFPDGTSTGDHFSNPAGDGILHALPTNRTRHWGDFGNLVNNGSGASSYDRIDKVIRLGGVVGRAITIHEGEDQGVSEQPSGNSGSRIGFCVIGYSNPEVISSATTS